MNVVIKWNKMGPEFSYNIWYATKVIGPWTRYNYIRLTDDIVDAIRNVGTLESYGPAAEYNEYTVTGLDQEKNYSFKVTCHDRYDAWWYSYTGPGEVNGGLSDPSSRPDPSNGNQQGFQLFITAPVILGIPGSYEPSDLLAVHWIHDIGADTIEPIDIGATI